MKIDKTTQISAPISRDTKKLLEEYVRATGMKKGHLIEMALRHHLQALQELPADVMVPPRIVVSRRSGEMIADLLDHPAAPTAPMRDLMAGDGPQGP